MPLVRGTKCNNCSIFINSTTFANCRFFSLFILLHSIYLLGWLTFSTINYISKCSVNWNVLMARSWEASARLISLPSDCPAWLSEVWSQLITLFFWECLFYFFFKTPYSASSLPSFLAARFTFSSLYLNTFQSLKAGVTHREILDSVFYVITSL